MTILTFKGIDGISEEDFAQARKEIQNLTKDDDKSLLFFAEWGESNRYYFNTGNFEIQINKTVIFIDWNEKPELKEKIAELLTRIFSSKGKDVLLAFRAIGDNYYYNGELLK